MSYFIDTQFEPPTLLRRIDFVDSEFRGAWIPTKSIVDYRFGENDFVEPIDEVDARERFPEAF